MNRKLYPFALILLIAALFCVYRAHADSQDPEVIRISLKKFQYTPDSITLTKGKHVVLELTSVDRPHGFSLPEFNIRADVNPDDVTRIDFTPNKTGRFTFHCDVFCGDGHENMSGVITVQ